jgi:O-antigen/teichoic acid export membrane protein
VRRHKDAGVFRVTADQAVRYVSSQLLQYLSTLARGLVLPNLLGPRGFGVLSTLNIVERYGSYYNLGIGATWLFRGPAKLAEGDEAGIRSMKTNALGFSLLTGVLWAIALVLFALVWRHNLAPQVFWGVLVVSLVPLVANLRGLNVAFLQVHQRFGVMGRGNLLESVVGLALPVALAVAFGVIGALGGRMLAGFLFVTFLMWQGRLLLRPNLEPGPIVEMLRFAFSGFLLIGVLRMLLATADRIVLAGTLGVDAVGYYSIGQTLSSPLSLLPAAAGTLLTTRLLASYAKDRQQTWPEVTWFTARIALASAFLAALISTVAPLALRFLFPTFTPGAAAAQLLPFVMYFETVGILSHYIFIGSGGAWRYIRVLAVVAAAAFALLWWVAPRFGITGVAMAVLGTSAVVNLGTVYFAGRSASIGRRRLAGFILGMAALGAMPLIILTAVRSIYPTDFSDPPVRLVAAALLKGGALTIAFGIVAARFGYGPRVLLFGAWSLGAQALGRSRSGDSRPQAPPPSA